MTKGQELADKVLATIPFSKEHYAKLVDAAISEAVEAERARTLKLLIDARRVLRWFHAWCHGHVDQRQMIAPVLNSLSAEIDAAKGCTEESDKKALDNEVLENLLNTAMSEIIHYGLDAASLWPVPSTTMKITVPFTLRSWLSKWMVHAANGGAGLKEEPVTPLIWCEPACGYLQLVNAGPNQWFGIWGAAIGWSIVPTDWTHCPRCGKPRPGKGKI